MKTNQKTYVEIDSAALRKNAAQFRSLLKPDTRLMAVVKANAYGHGMIDVARTLKNDVDWLGVDSIDDALALHRARIRLPILILGYTPLVRLADAIRIGARQTVYNIETIKALATIAKNMRRRIPVHMKVETGLYRQGVLERDLDAVLTYLQSSQHLFLEGVSMHFANIEDTTDHRFAKQQLATYERIIRRIESRVGAIPYKHTAATAATMLMPETHGNLVRVGIGMYGLWPSRETKVSLIERGQEKLRLHPVLTWKSIVAQIKDVPAGEGVGYGLTETVQRKTKIAIIPVGYWDGYDRKLSSVGNVLIRGHRCKVIGRVAMNMIIVDVSHIRQIKLEDEVILLGKQGSETITAEELAQKIGTINYEVVTRINPLIVRRIITNS